MEPRTVPRAPQPAPIQRWRMPKACLPSFPAPGRSPASKQERGDLLSEHVSGIGMEPKWSQEPSLVPLRVRS